MKTKKIVCLLLATLFLAGCGPKSKREVKP